LKDKFSELICAIADEFDHPPPAEFSSKTALLQPYRFMTIGGRGVKASQGAEWDFLECQAEAMPEKIFNM
jgi:hypothetical protein